MGLASVLSLAAARDCHSDASIDSHYQCVVEQVQTESKRGEVGKQPLLLLAALSLELALSVLVLLKSVELEAATAQKSSIDRNDEVRNHWRVVIQRKVPGSLTPLQGP